MKTSRYVPAILAALVSAAAWAADPPAAALEHRWVYLATNLLVDKSVEDALALVERAAKAGYNGLVLTDSKFMRWDQMPEAYLVNVRRVRQACRDHKLACIACVCHIGYCNDLLSRDPNLAEGLPVADAPFVAKNGRLVPTNDSAGLINGGFERWKGNVPAGWRYVDQPGKISFIDRAVRREGLASLRMQDIGLHDPQNGHGRACQTLTVKPFRYYRVSAAVKTQDFESAGEVQIVVLGKDGTSLNYHRPKVKKTQDWQRIDMTFNSLESSEVNLYLGVWGGKRGKIWWDDVRLDPGGLVNVVRRDGAPLRAASADGRTVFEEGRDFQNARDPKLGMDPWPGGFTAWHEPPVVSIPPGSRIHDGQKVLLSYFHTAVIYEEQMMCCMAEPKVYEILRWQIGQVHKHLQPDGYFLQHDEIRMQGWDESCRRSGKTPGELLAENVRKCMDLVRAEDPGKPIYVWSDMFDPNHNAQKTGPYYLVKGNGPWYGSWKGLDKDVVIINWNSDPAKRAESMRHFAGLGQRQILAGYYDGPVDSIRGWLRDGRQVQGITGAMYTTWRQQYRDVEAFASQLKQP
jgi:hypothetical protein